MSRSGVRFPSQAPCDLSRDPGQSEPSLGVGLFAFLGWGSGWSAGGLVVVGGVEFELAEELAGDGVDDAYVEVGDER